MDTPEVSVVLLTWNEEANIAACLASLAGQTVLPHEVLVIDAASTDRTAQIVHEAQAGFPTRLRLHVAPHRIPIGQARNLGVRDTMSPIIAFLSADAEAHEEWLEEALRTLERADAAYGLQEHAPHKWTIAASVRGLRYHYPKEAVDDARPFASHVSAAYRREVLEDFPFEDATSAAEDLLLAARATDAGYRLAYNPHMIARHHDVQHAGDEMTKAVREGRALGRWSGDLGFSGRVATWTLMIVGAILLAAAIPSWATLVILLLVIWAPALRRAPRRMGAMPLPAVILGVLASPVFDLAFVVNYARGLWDRARRQRPTEAPPSIESPESPA